MATRILNGNFADWHSALCHYQTLTEHYEALVERYALAEGRADAECPRIDRYFDVLGLEMGMTVGHALVALGHYVARTGDRIDIAATASEFLSYQERAKAAKLRHGLTQLQSCIDEVFAEYVEAQKSLLRTPAPDHDALFTKLSIAFGMQEDEEADDVLSDAKRLLCEQD